MTSKLTIALVSATSLLVAGLAQAGVAHGDTTTTTETRTEIHRTAHVVVLEGQDAAMAAGQPHQIVVTSRAIDGETPQLQVKMLGADSLDGETLDIAALEEGETRTFTTREGKEVVVSRGEEGITLSVDGKEIRLPSLTSVNVLASGGHAIAGGPTWVHAGDMAGHSEDVIVLGGTPHVFPAAPLAMASNFENLKSLEGLEPEVREKVVAALHEIFSKQHGAFAFTTTLPAPADGSSARAPSQRMIVRQVVVDPSKESNAQVE